MDDHNYVPLIEMGKRPASAKSACPITGKHQERPQPQQTVNRHQSRNDYKYATPILKKEALDEPADKKAFEDLQKVCFLLRT